MNTKKIQYKYQNFVNACNALETIISLYNTIKTTGDQDTIIIYQDSLIKRFILCSGVTWRYLKLYLEINHGVKVSSPKTTFRECCNQAVTTEQETAILMQMIDDSNQATDNYGEKIANKISQNVIMYWTLMKTIINRTNPDQHT